MVKFNRFMCGMCVLIGALNNYLRCLGTHLLLNAYHHELNSSCTGHGAKKL